MQLTNFFEDRLLIAESLDEGGDLSMINTFATDLPRVFIVAAASHFETVVTDYIHDFFSETSQENPAVLEFMKRKALFRNYHTLFEWKGNSANGFFAVFGEERTKHYKALVQDTDWVGPAASDFLKLGRARNELVHGDFASHSPSLSAKEVQQRFISAQRFVQCIPAVIRLQDIPAAAAGTPPAEIVQSS
ncbi:hypothetical protein I6E68_02725 [Salinibacterium sp. NSLL150]|uniref:HEPN domain-containing protein n=1 Tax=unclassified Salinibacterium TaxID=2632331 RepID=UPI0018CD3442|nr:MULTISPECIES: HEPN domain-containing protein [unclassified Salinibacterium]MBH0098052.1 hypothetical protein [Salinibacterium sp. NSLL35]MBH0100807.1 hypothetical protein [Salinibacterium sp. NSLL150]MBH0103566.1 hypothetical protein [Salinibacterium sp. NSLL16]MBH0106327.1 hypothetical protein [Salinibacterium sp. NSLL17]